MAVAIRLKINIGDLMQSEADNLAGAGGPQFTLSVSPHSGFVMFVAAWLLSLVTLLVSFGVKKVGKDAELTGAAPASPGAV